MVTVENPPVGRRAERRQGIGTGSRQLEGKLPITRCQRGLRRPGSAGGQNEGAEDDGSSAAELLEGNAAAEGVYFYSVKIGNKEYAGNLTLLR